MTWKQETYGDWYSEARVIGTPFTGYFVNFYSHGRLEYRSKRVGLTLARLWARRWHAGYELPEGDYHRC